VPFFLCLQQIEDISNQVEKIGFGLQEEVEEFFVLQVSGAQMQVRNPESSEMLRRHALSPFCSLG